MDVKAMARSKRSHTKQHQPRKPHRPTTQSTTSSSSSSSKDPKVLKKEGERKRSNPGTSLPSNLDRYYDSDEEEGNFGSESDAAKTDVVKPKSKGADFAFLKSQAMSQSPANFTDSYESVLPDFSQGLGSMLRGEDFLSWTGGVFLMEDEATSNSEVPFLSLNLKANSEDYARISFAQRLFIEEDICPPELRFSEENDRDGKMAVLTSVEPSSVVAGLVLGSSKVERNLVSKEGPSLRSDSFDSTDGLALSFRQEKQSDDTVAAHKSDPLGILDPKKAFKASQEAELDNKTPRFEAKAAEAELDMLLDSFNEAKFFDSSSNISAVNKEKTSASLVPIGKSLTHGALSNNSWHLDISRSSFPANNMDKDIDDLLQETSNFAVGHATLTHGALSNKSGHLDISRSSFPANNLDKDIDDLLQETASFAVGHATSHSTEVNADSINKQLSSAPGPGAKSKVMEDFDSWLDTF